ncbi:hypothetical protein Vretimale_1030 [Volvox reticuliferus]|uniref:Uncharacterized protein n=1 Tax=Volvox reticuliferus TaxID=1737510 RepID=A0A8J4FXV7_9CHLO|nr:hypothetical protein Vretifemale_10444 [Volvox reticuliferus]GIL94919.1 hypothetical protein Vretimale_1030 [Volvox reticuliferus]
MKLYTKRHFARVACPALSLPPLVSCSVLPAPPRHIRTYTHLHRDSTHPSVRAVTRGRTAPSSGYRLSGLGPLDPARPPPPPAVEAEARPGPSPAPPVPAPAAAVPAAPPSPPPDGPMLSSPLSSAASTAAETAARWKAAAALTHGSVSVVASRSSARTAAFAGARCSGCAIRPV